MITYNNIDELIFSQWFNTTQGSRSDGPPQQQQQPQQTILINPPTIQNNVAIIFTEPRVGLTAQVLFYPPFSLTIVANKGRTLMQSRDQPIQVIDVNSMWLNGCKESAGMLYGDNPTFASIGKFRIILQKLAVGNLSITQILYETIRDHMNNYTQYRNLQIIGDNKAFDGHNPQRTRHCRSTRSGIQP